MAGESIRVRGTVQGVGFRPHVWRLAQAMGIRGRVCNDSEGVLISAWGEPGSLDRLVERIGAEKPPLAVIDSIERAPIVDGGEAPPTFTIAASAGGAALTSVSPDAATCADCLAEVLDRGDRRYGYPFTNCTHCGPRFSIIRAIPYDRANTSMAGFAMCAACTAEYSDPGNRRFHAQPNACPECGPTLWLEQQGGTRLDGLQNHLAIERAALLIGAGAIVAVKGIGGIQLACDAGNASAVTALRSRKQRYRKPLALLARDIRQIEGYAVVSEEAAALLQSAAAPIVILPRRTDSAAQTLAEDVAPGQDTLGFMLPNSPLHHWLVRRLDGPVVLTSGNRSEEPQCIDNDEARARLGAIADYFLLHDREIVNRIDDSVLKVAAGRPRSLRRARGYAPQPLALPPGFEAARDILAMGADLKNTFCLLHHGQAVLSQHMGDLEDASTQLDYRRNIALLQTLFDARPRRIVTDRHPDYHSTRYGQQLAAAEGLPVDAVQHHHAHIAATMAEHRLPLGCRPVLGIALDGLGYGDDGSFWGGEFLLVDYAKSSRLGRLRPAAMLGGNLAMRQPWRNTLAQLLATGRWRELAQRYRQVDILNFLQAQPLGVLLPMAQKRLNSPPSSSAGRLFDAVAAALDLHREEQLYEGEAASALQCLAERSGDTTGAYPCRIHQQGELAEIDWSPLWPALLEDLAQAVPLPTMAARFHRGFADAITETAHRLAAGAGVDTIALGGGVMQNSLLLAELDDSLRGLGYRVLLPERIPANDGGIALGQALVGFARAQ
jgi:hydrogenase maturation protein HypF